MSRKHPIFVQLNVKHRKNFVYQVKVKPNVSGERETLVWTVNCYFAKILILIRAVKLLVTQV